MANEDPGRMTWKKVTVTAGVSRGEAHLSIDCPVCGQLEERFEGGAELNAGELQGVAKDHVKIRHRKAKASTCAGGCGS